MPRCLDKASVAANTCTRAAEAFASQSFAITLGSHILGTFRAPSFKHTRPKAGRNTVEDEHSPGAKTS